MAVRGDRILAVGGNEAVRGLAGPQTRQIDLEGKTVLPGLIDSHLHLMPSAMYEFDHQMPQMDSIADVLAYVRSRAAALRPGQWIGIDQVFITRLRQRRFPTRSELDEAAPHNPVAFRTGPDAALNSLALKLSGIDRDFKIADGQAGQIERDPQTGEPTGILRNCHRFVKYQSPDRTPSDGDRRQRLRALLAAYNEVGITSVTDRDDHRRRHRGLPDAEGSRRADLPHPRHLLRRRPVAAGTSSRRRSATRPAHPLHRRDPMLWLHGIKIFLDGGMLTGSAYMREPWGMSKIYSIDDPNYRGLLFIQPQRLFQIARLVLGKGLQLTAHAVGDGAIETLVDAYERVDRELPVRDLRPCMCHANFMTPEAIEKMRRLGVVADMQPAWLYLDGATLREQFGDARLAWFQPYKTLAERGVTVGGGSDHMQKIGRRRSINTYDPFLGMWTTLVRRPRWTEATLHSEQALDRAAGNSLLHDQQCLLDL